MHVTHICHLSTPPYSDRVYCFRSCTSSPNTVSTQKWLINICWTNKCMLSWPSSSYKRVENGYTTIMRDSRVDIINEGKGHIQDKMEGAFVAFTGSCLPRRQPVRPACDRTSLQQWWASHEAPLTNSWAFLFEFRDIKAGQHVPKQAHLEKRRKKNLYFPVSPRLFSWAWTEICLPLKFTPVNKSTAHGGF